jgi:hypothetical protein
MKRPHPYIPYDTRADAPRMTLASALALIAFVVWSVACLVAVFARGQ